jgi:radical SAM superfamily enzyme YgiQ (UPF0313 family)
MPSIPQKKLDRILRTVEKPGRYTGGEWNASARDPATAEIRVALAYPDAYEIGMSHLGQKILYGLLNAQPHIAAERVFAPWPDFERGLRDAGLPLFSLENRIPLVEFDILGFSLLYELNSTNILTMLDLGGLPFLSAERSGDQPLVLGGGPACFNPEPLADIFDLFLIGDGEEGILEIIDVVGTAKKRKDGKSALLKTLGEFPESMFRPITVRCRPERRFISCRDPWTERPRRWKNVSFAIFKNPTFPGRSSFPTSEPYLTASLLRRPAAALNPAGFARLRFFTLPSDRKIPLISSKRFSKA